MISRISSYTGRRIRMLSTLPISYDYIVIGGGSGGSVLAEKLSRDSTKTVLLLEAGQPSHRYIWFHIPVGYLYTIDNPRSDWRYRTVPQKGLNGRHLIYPRGLGLGGCSLINGMLYLRGQAEDYNSWAEAVGDSSWRWEHMLDLFKGQEMYHGGETPLHGSTGPWCVEKVRTNWEILSAFASAAEQCGVPQVTDFNGGNNFGVGLFDVNQRDGFRLNAYQAFLPQKRSNLHVLSDVVVEKLLLDESGSDCHGVRVRQLSSGELSEFVAVREVALTAGAVGSVQILERSGVGRGDVLDKAGIPTVRDLPGVGENLQDHLQIRTVFEVDNVPTLNTLANSLWGKARIALEYAVSRSGPMSAAPSQMGAFLHSSPDIDRPDLEYHVQPLSLPAFGQPLDSFNAFTASVCHLRPTSRGSIHVTSADIQTAPVIDPNYLQTDEDRLVAARALLLTREIVGKMDSKYNARERRPGLAFQSLDDLARAAGDIGTTIFHPVGTCKMASSVDPMGVVDSSLRVRGIDRLRVADASVMPTIISGNTANPVMVIAEKCANMMIHTAAT